MDSERKRLMALVQHYELVLGDMQQGTFYAQDLDGCLRRWRPSPPISKNGVHIDSGEVVRVKE